MRRACRPVLISDFNEGGGPRAVLMLTVNSFNPVLKVHSNMKRTPLNSSDFRMGTLQIRSNRNHFYEGLKFKLIAYRKPLLQVPSSRSAGITAPSIMIVSIPLIHRTGRSATLYLRPAASIPSSQKPTEAA